LHEIVQRVRDGRLRTNIGETATLGDAVAAFNRTERRKGKTIIRVRYAAIDASGRPALSRLGRPGPMALGIDVVQVSRRSDILQQRDK
jgi:hypothetical protein